MLNPFASRAANSVSLRQAYILLAIGIFCFLGALLWHSAPPLGVFLFGLGILIAAIVNPARLLAAGILFSTVGLDVYLTFGNIVPYAGSALILTIGVALLAIAYAARKGYIGAGAVTPAILVLLIGLIEFPPFTHLLPGNYVAFLLSLWFPAIGLLALGLVYLVLARRQ